MRCCGKSGGRNKKTAAPRPFFIFNSSSLSEKRSLLPAREQRPQTPPACGQALSAGTSCPGRGVGDAPRQLPPTRPCGREAYSKNLQDVRQNCNTQDKVAKRRAKLQGTGHSLKGPALRPHSRSSPGALRPLTGSAAEMPAARRALRAHKKARIKKRTKSRQIPPFGPKAVFFPLAGSRPPGRLQRIKLVRMPPSCCGKTAPACAPALMQRSSQAMFRARLRMVCSPS